MRVRVVVAEDSLLVREGMVRVLESGAAAAEGAAAADVASIDVVGVAGSLPELIELVERLRPDVVVTDIRMPPTNTDEGIRAAAEFRTTHPGLGVVVLSQFAEPEYTLALLSSGSFGRAYLLKERLSEPGELLGAVHTVASGGSVIDPRVVEHLVSGSRRSDPLAVLTPREREVLAQIAAGKSNAGIAGVLWLTERGVEKHIGAVFTKLGLAIEPDIHRRVAAVLVYLGARPPSG